MGKLHDMKRLLALLLAVEMILGMNGFTVLADSLPEGQESAVQTEVVAETPSENKNTPVGEGEPAADQTPAEPEAVEEAAPAAAVDAEPEAVAAAEPAETPDTAAVDAAPEVATPDAAANDAVRAADDVLAEGADADDAGQDAANEQDASADGQNGAEDGAAQEAGSGDNEETPAVDEQPSSDGQGDSADVNRSAEAETKEEQKDPASETEGQEKSDADAENKEADAEKKDAETAEEKPAEVVATKTVYSYSDSFISVEAVCTDAAAIPDDAELVVTPVTAGSREYAYDAYMEALNNVGEKEYSAENTLLYDIAFMVPQKDADGNPIPNKFVEVQPTAGSVNMKVEFKQKQLSEEIGAEDGENVEVLHLPISEEVKENIDSTKEATEISSADITVESVEAQVSLNDKAMTETTEFTAADLSVWAFSLNQVSKEITIPVTDQTFKETSNYLIQGPFEELANFGLIGFSEIIQNEHIHSNIATNKWTFKNNNTIGRRNTNRLPEVIYIGQSMDIQVGWPIIEMYCPGSKVVLGNELGRNGKVTAVNPTDVTYNATFGGKQFEVKSGEGAARQENGQYVSNMFMQESAEKKYLDLAALKEKAEGISAAFAEREPSGIRISPAQNPSNTLLVEIGDADLASINFTAAELDERRRNYGVLQINEQAVDNKTHLLIINVDAAGRSTLDLAPIEMLNSRQTYTGEVQTWTTGNVIYNVYDSSASDKMFRGTINTAQAATAASILAPDASVIAKGNVNGEIIADTITINVEFHRDSITFTNAIPSSDKKGGLKAAKTLNGSNEFTQKFNAKLIGLNGAPMPKGSNGNELMKENDDEEKGMFIFGYLNFNGEGDYRYLMMEDIPEGAISIGADQKYKDGIIYDASEYIVEVHAARAEGGGIGISGYTIYKMDGGSETKLKDIDYQTGKAGVVTFANETGSPISIGMELTKTYDGAWPAEGFQFELSPKKYVSNDNEVITVEEDGNIVPPQSSVTYDSTATATEADPKATFGELTFYRAGKYYYTIKEVVPANADDTIIYDTDKHEVIVTVTENNGVKTAAVSYDGSDDLTVSNVIKRGSLKLAKSVTGTEATDKDFTFTVTLKDKNNAAVKGTFETDQAGKSVTFGDDGTATVTLKKDESLTIKGLVAGTKYTVTEGTLPAGYKKTAPETDPSGTIVYNETAEASFTNAYSASGHTHAEIGKTLTGKDLVNGQFSFTIASVDGPMKDENGADIASASLTVTNQNGKAVFPEFYYTAADAGKEYKYQISENAIDASQKGISQDTENGPATIYVKVVVGADKGDGTLEDSVVTYYSDAAMTQALASPGFVNKYAPAPTTFAPAAEKQITGLPEGVTSDKTFTFTLTGTSDNTKTEGTAYTDTASVTGAGTTSFKAIEYTSAGVYEYTISENDGGAGGYTYAKGNHTLIVTVTDVNGELQAVGEYKDNNAQAETQAIFTNTYKAGPTTATLTGTKAFEGKAISKNSGKVFHFTMKGVSGTKAEGQTLTASVTGDGSTASMDFSFGEISFAEAGTYKYEVTEDALGEDMGGFSKDNTIFTVTYEVTDDGSGVLKASRTIEGGDAVAFTNTYEAAVAKYKPAVEKTVSGYPAGLTPNQKFDFTLTGTSANTKTEGTAYADAVSVNGVGSANFKEITYTEEGTYTYEIRETAGSEAGFTYDDKAHTLTVTVSDNNGVLSASAVYSDGASADKATFENKYKAGPVAIELRGTKTLTGGKTLTAGEFAFRLKNSKGEIVKTVNNDADGKFVFNNLDILNFKEAGTYTFTVDEATPTEAGVTSRGETYSITVTVTDDGSGALSASVTGATAVAGEANAFEGLDFTNDYKAGSVSIELGGMKTLTNTSAADHEFVFELKETTAGATYTDTAKRNGAGTYKFAGLTYEEIGVHTYEIREKAANDGYLYDDTVYTVTVEVKDDFTGKLKATVTGARDNGTGLDFTNEITSVKVSKTDITGEEEIAGAQIEIRDKAGNVKAAWTSGTTAHEITGLLTGVEYTLHEVAAPNATYTIAADTTFTIGEDGKVTTTGYMTEGGVLLVKDALTSIKISKVDIADGKEVPGATIQILEGEEVVRTWTSGTAPETIEGLKTSVEYILRETVAPEGYTIASDTTFTISETGKVTSTATINKEGVILVEDTKTSVKISKVDIAGGAEVAGATIQILEGKEVVRTWTSGTAPETIEGLKTGVTYTLRETVAPEGYTIASDTTFSIDETGKVTSTAHIREDGVVLVEDTKTSIKISKVDVAGGAEVAGATIQILEDEKVVRTWTSGTTAETIEGLKTDVTYTLRETVAPDGYTIATDTTFIIDKDGKVTSTAHIREDGVVLVEDTKTVVKISKTDVTGEEELAGAEIRILDEDKNVVAEWTSTNKVHTIEGLKTGVTYTLHEVTGPVGYKTAADTTFKIEENGKVTSTGTVNKDGVILIKDDKTRVRISKTDITGEEELEGATLQVINKKGEIVKSWTSGKTAEMIEGLIVGEEYTIRELTAPEGYTVATDTKFTINADGTINAGTAVSTDKDGNEVILVKDAKTSVKISKVEIAGSAEIKGAHIQILRDGKVVEEWDSTTEPHQVEGLATGVTYTLKETVAPKGYTVSAETTFMLDEKGNVTSSTTRVSDGVLLVEDAKTVVRVSKTDITNDQELPGAHLQILDKDSKIVAEWDSTSEVKVLEGVLNVNETYTLRETTAPDGYLVTTDTVFSLDSEGKVVTEGSTTTDGSGNVVIVVADKKTSVSISKVDVYDSKEVPGATLEVIDSKGDVKATWKSTNEAHVIEGLKTGETYILRETVAPEGYKVATDVTFTIGADGKVTSSGKVTEDGVVLLEDTRKVYFTVNKTEAGGGKEVTGAVLEVLEKTADGEKVLDRWTSKEGETHDFGDVLEAGKTYILRETVAPAGYGRVTTDIEVTVNADSTVKAEKLSTKDEGGRTIYLVEDDAIHFNVNKVDAGNGEEVEGARLEVFAVGEGGSETLVEGWTSKKGETHDFGAKLEAGKKYVLRETNAPAGYGKITTDITIEVAEDGTIISSIEPSIDEKTGKEVYLVNDDAIRFNVNKVDAGNGEEVEGARLEVFAVGEGGSETLVDSWTSKKGETHDFGAKLEAGKKYVLRETNAPAGYGKVTTDITIEVAEDGTITSNIEPSIDEKTGKEVYLVNDDAIRFNVNKVDAGNGEEVEGAKLEVFAVGEDGSETLVDSWVSKKGETHDFGDKLEAGKKYVLRETNAPVGYSKVTTDINITVAENGKITADIQPTKDEAGNEVYLVKDDALHVVVNKVDIVGGEELDGAVIQILEKTADGENLIDSWTSKKGETHDFGSKLSVGKTYILRETVAPEGYTITSDTTFTIDETGKVTSGGSVVEDGVLLVEDAKTKISVSKTDIANGKEVEGATIQILDKDGKVVEEWTSTKEAHVIEGLKTGVEYTLRETVAPDGYTVATDTKFTIDEKGKVTSGGSVVEDGVLLVEDAKTKISVSKTDIANGEEVEGATIQILDKDGKVVEEWTSTKEAHVIEGLKTGVEYTLRETVAPDGYTVATDTKFTIDEKGKVTSGGSVVEDGVLLVEDAKTKISVSKTDIANGEEVEGATIQILDKDGKVVEEWTSTKEAHVIEGLKTGVEYTLRETVAPEGYTIATDTKFTIDETGKVTSSGSVTEDGVLLVEDAKTKISVSKTDIANGEEVEGATIQILDKDGKVVEEWVSTKEAHVIEGLKTGVEYTLRETVAPDGYTIATDTKFTIDETGKVTSSGSVTEDGVLLVEDAKTKVSVSKTDIADGEEVEGATIQILDKDGKVVEEWKSTKEAHVIEGLKTGVEYTLRETVAPDGYTIATDTKFTIDETGKVTSSGSVTEDGVLLVEDAKTKVSVSKTDIADGEEVEGATIQILDKDGKVVEEWKSTKEAHVIEGLKTGVEYTLRETVAPDGYTVATDTKFTIDETGKVTSSGSVTEDGVLLVEDAKTKISVSKADIADGKEVEGATIQILDKDGKVVEEWKSTKEAHVIEGLKTGVEYTLRETVAPDGYTIATDTTFTIAADGTVTTTGSKTEDGVLLVNDAKTRIRVSKVDIVGGREVEGATIQILDADGKAVTSWTSGKEAHVIEGLKTGVTYTLRETVAPAGYTVATDTTFTIDTTGKVTMISGHISKDGILLVEDAKTKVSVSKTDIADGKEVEGATIQILDKDGKVVEEWVSTKEAHVIEGLKTGEEYTLRETVAPDGYTIATDTKFSINEKGKVTSTGSVTEDGVLLVEDAKTKISVSKTDIADGEEVKGATIQILDKDGKVVEEWKSTEEAHVIEGLKTGVEYTLRETVAPDGYTIATDTKFTIDETGKVTSSGSVTEDGVLLVEDAKTKISVSKTDIANGEEVEGATIQILDKDGKEVEKWVSTKEAHVIEGLKTGVEYTLRETVAPDGYTIATDTKFSIDEKGKVTSTGSVTEDGVLLVEDAKTKISVSKTDIANGEEVEGATIQILDKDGKEVEKWVSTKEAHVIEGLKTGVEYTLRETVAPDGYTIATDTKFTIDETGKVTSSGSVTEDGVLLVEDAKTKISVSKTDIADGEEVEGATIQILDTDGKVVEEWKSTKEAHVIEGLKTGVEYTLRETVAPDGYTVATDTKFTIDETGKVTSSGSVTEDGVLLVEDAKTKVSVSKTDIADGEEVEGATIQILDKDGKVVEEWKSTKEAHVIEGLKTGVEYTLRETVAPDGYTIATDTKFSIDEKGKVTSTGSVTEDGVLLVEDAKTKISVSKADIADGKEVKGAMIQILDKEGKVVEEWKSTEEAHVIEGLKTGVEYTLRETVAPDGYTIATDTTFTIAADGTVTTTGSKTEDGVLLVNDAKTRIRVSKVDIVGGKEVEGATIQILDADGKVITSWTSGKEAHVIEGLKTGVTYTLRETVAPAGYTVATDTTFTIDTTGKVTMISGHISKDGILLVEDAKTTVSVSKTDIADGKEVEGATIQILDKDGKVVEEWVSTKEAHVIEGLKTGEEYTLRETVAPEGYAIATDTKFTIDEKGKVTSSGSVTEDGTLLIEDSAIRFTVNKTTVGGGEEVEGAVLKLVEKAEDGTEKDVDSWTSRKGETHDFGKKLKVGKTYILRETVAPAGYGKVTTDIAITVAEDGKVTAELKTTTDEAGNTIYLVEDDAIRFNVNKTDAGNGEEVEGAVLEVLEILKDGSEKKVDSWTSKAGETHDFGDKLEAGKTYILRETNAPAGYGKVTTDIEVKVKEDGTITTTLPKTTDKDGKEVYLVNDDAIRFTVNKVDAGNGEEVEGAELVVLEKAEDGTEKKVDSWTSKKGETHDFGDKLEAGKTYILRETNAPEGYGKIETDIEIKVNADGTIETTLPKSTDKDGNEVYLVEDTKEGETPVEVHFTVNKTDAGNGEEVEGAELQLIEVSEDGTETVYDSWTSKAGETHDFGDKMKAGKTYVLRETVAPAGYGKIETDIEIKVNADGTIETSLPKSTDEDGNVVYLVEDTKEGETPVEVHFTVNKTDAGNGEEVEGAELQLIEVAEDGTETVYDSWTSKAGETHDFGDKMKAGKTYVLRETVAPAGYGKVTTDIAITVAEDGKITAELKTTTDEAGNTIYLVEDDAIRFTVNKVDAGNGEEVDGAEIVVLEKAADGSEKTVDSWTSKAGETHDFGDKLEAGKEYILRETNAPVGYGKVTTDIKITVADDGKITADIQPTKDKDGNEVYLIEDDAIRFNVNKVDAGNGEEVEGAEIVVLEKAEDGTEKTVDSWTSKKGETHDFGDKLEAGKTYILRETNAPAGYGKVTTDIKIAVADDGKITADIQPSKDKDGKEVYLVEDDAIRFTVNKTDAGNGEEVEGAELKVIEKSEDGTETVVDSWTSKKGETHDFGDKLEAGKEYILRETNAPVGYGKVTTDIKITVAEDGKITADIQPTKDKDGNEVYLIEDDAIRFNVNKIDAGNGEEVEGAELVVLEKAEDGTEKTVDSWTSKKGETHDFGDKLEAGKTYILRETNAPEGYGKIETDIEIKVNADGTIETTLPKSTDKDGNEVYLVEDTKEGETPVEVHFTVNKTDAGNGEEVEGAELQLIEVAEDGTETVYDSWTSKAGETHDFGDKMKAGKTYVLRETVAPAGYGKVTTDIAITVAEDGKITAELKTTTDEAGNTIYLVEDDAIRFNVNKVDAGNGEEVEGAEIVVLEKAADGTEKTVDSWISKAGETHDFGDKLEAGKTYILRETNAPAGYGKVTTDIEVKVNEDGTITTTLPKSTDKDGKEVYLVNDDAIRFSVNKVDAGNGEEVEGAEIVVLEKAADGTEKTVDSWTSKAGETHDFGDKLEAGKTYILRETNAPAGYGKVTTDIEVKVNEDGTITTTLPKSTDKDGKEVYLVNDDAIRFNVNKVDAGNGEEVEGAEIVVLEKAEDGTEKTVDSWTSKKGETHDFGEKLEAGKTYILRETNAPEGYGKIETDIEIKVNADGTIETTLPKSTDEDGNVVYLVEDTKEGETPVEIHFNVNKTDAGNGEEVEGAVLEVLEKLEDGTEKTVDSWTSKAGETHDFGDKLEAGKTYVLRETNAPEGYGKIETDIEIKVNADGTIETTLPKSTDKDGNVVYLVEDTKEGETPVEIHFNVNKTDAGNGEEVEGAVLEVLEKLEDGTEKTVDRWTSKKGETHDFGEKLEAGKTYILRETNAPEGYGKIETDIEIKVSADGTIETTLPKSTDEDGNVVYLVEDTKEGETPVEIHFNVNKTDAGNGEEVEGAVLEVLEKLEDGTEKTVDSWTSKAGETHDFGDKLEAGKTYILRETNAPEGYGKIETDIEIKVNADGTIETTLPKSTDKDGNVVYLVEDTKEGETPVEVHFTVNKTDAGNGEEVEGAELQLIEVAEDGTETVYDSWTSKAGETHDFGDKMKAGRTYVLRETVAPEGYGKIETDIEIKVNADGTIEAELKTTTDEAGNTVYLVENTKKGPVEVHFNVNKVATGSGEEVEGAVLEVIEKAADGTETVVDSWTSKAGETHDFGEKLEAGKSYILRETTAPAGYVRVKTDITFTVNADGTVEASLPKATDEEGNEVHLFNNDAIHFIVSGVDARDGADLDGIEIQIIEVAGDGTEKVISSWTTQNGETHDFGKNFEGGKDYILRITGEPEGFKPVTEDKEVKVGEDGTIESDMKTTKDKDGNDVHLMEVIPEGQPGPEIHFNVNKVATGSGEEVEGAVLEVIEKAADGTETVVDSWTSKAGETHDFGEKLEAGKSYILRETTAPEGYVRVKTDITFTVNADGTVEASLPKATDEEGNEVHLFNNDAIHFIVSGVDARDGSDLDGIEIQIIEVAEDGTEKTIESWSTINGETHDFGKKFVAGKAYILRITGEPEGFKPVTEDKEVKVGEDGTIESDMKTVKDEEGFEVHLMEVIPEGQPGPEIHFTINKVDASSSEEVDGAEIEILEKDETGAETLVDSWTSKAGETHDFGDKMEAGKTYILREMVAPDGYNRIGTDIEVKVNADGTIETTLPKSTDKDGNVVYLVEDTKIGEEPVEVHFIVNKTDAGSGEEVEGATLELIEVTEDGTEIVYDSWTSKAGETHDFGAKMKAGRTYVLRETVAPEGYSKIETDIEIKVNEDGTVEAELKTSTDEAGNTVYLVENTKEGPAVTEIHFNVNKVEAGSGEEVEGAALVVFEKAADGTEKQVDSWTSKKGETHDFGEKLEAGKTYILRETVAPDGYNKIETDIEIKVNADGTIETTLKTATAEDGSVVYLVENTRKSQDEKPVSVRISKVDIADGKELEGARIQVITKDAQGKDVIVEEWISAKGGHEIKGLKAGVEYILRETVAPKGYNVTTDITFKVDENGKVTTSGTLTRDKDGNTVILIRDTKQKETKPQDNKNKTNTNNTKTTTTKTTSQTRTTTTSRTKPAKTGDHAPVTEYAVLFMMSAALMAYVIGKRKREEEA